MFHLNWFPDWHESYLLPSNGPILFHCCCHEKQLPNIVVPSSSRCPSTQTHPAVNTKFVTKLKRKIFISRAQFAVYCCKESIGEKRDSCFLVEISERIIFLGKNGDIKFRTKLINKCWISLKNHSNCFFFEFFSMTDVWRKTKQASKNCIINWKLLHKNSFLNYFHLLVNLSAHRQQHFY